MARLMVSHRILDSGLLLLPPDRAPDHDWDDWRARSYFYHARKEEFAELDLLTHNANKAYAIAVSEWIEAWLSPYTSNHSLRHYIEASWAALLDRDNSQYFQIDEDEWRGPVLGPTVICIGILNEIFFESYDEHRMAFRSCYALNLARHLMRNESLPGSAFGIWRSKVEARLQLHHSWVAEGKPEPSLLEHTFPQGRLVSREAFDLSQAYDPNEAQRQLEAYAARIPDGNPFHNG